MTHFISISILFVILSLGSCSETHKLIKVKEIVFNAEFNPRLPSSGTFERNDSIYYYLTDVATSKKVNVYNSAGKLIYVVDLHKASKILDGIDNINMINFDTLFGFNQAQNNLVLLDYQGNILKRIDLDSLVDHRYIFRVSTKGTFYKDGRFYFGTGIPNNQYRNMGSMENRKYNGRLMLDLPPLIEFSSLFTNEKPSFKLLLPGYFGNILTENDFFVEASYYSFTDESMIYHSNFNDSVTVINLKTYKKKLYQLSSNFSNIIVPPVPIDSLDRIPITNKLRCYGAINQILYDSSQKLFYVLFLLDTHGNEEGQKSRETSIAVYNHDFEKLMEEKWPLHKYISFITINSEGLILIKYDEDNYIPKQTKKYTYEIYRYKN